MTAMDKLRRKPKPKPPAIETSLDQKQRQSTDTTDSSHSDHTANSSINGAAEAPASVSANAKPKKSRSPFRNLRLRGSGKRARGSPPAELPPSSPPPPAVVAHGGNMTEIKARSARTGTDTDAPSIPGFLSMSEQDIDGQFQNLTWAERLRVARAGEDSKWGHYKQVDRERGQMDRYSNIKPWNHNRVKLQVPEDEFDYVNASTIELPCYSDASRPPLRYIAMQGPTEPSFDYVWRMVAEQVASPAVIIQLTCMVEGGIVKCHQYFPFDEEDSEWTLNEGNVWGDEYAMCLKFDSSEELADGAIEKRKLLLQVGDEEEPRVVWHLLYRKWPDFGLPEIEDLDSFFELMKLSRELSEPGNPRIVHCSAGVGRTGTFITLEHLMRELDLGGLRNLDDTDVDLVHDTVDLLRQQRRAMVQGDPQYRFIYQVMRRLWQEKYGGDESDSGAEPAAKRLEVDGTDPFVEEEMSINDADGSDGSGR